MIMATLETDIMFDRYIVAIVFPEVQDRNNKKWEHLLVFHKGQGRYLMNYITSSSS